MRYLFVMAMLALAVPAFAQQNEAEKLYRGFEKKLADAKAGYKVAFDMEIVDKTDAIKIKGDLLVVTGNMMNLQFAGTTNGDGGPKAMTGNIVSNGQKLGQKHMRGGGPEQSKTEESPPLLTTYVSGYLPATGVYISLNHAQRPKPEAAPEKMKVAGFQLLGKEKIGDNATQIVEFTVHLPGEIDPATCKLWIDVKTNLPLKRVLDIKDRGNQTIRLTENYSNWQIDPKLTGGEFALPK